MKTLKFLFAGTIVLMLSQRASSQITLDFETVSLPADSFWNGSDFSGGMSFGDAFFPNYYVDWGGGMTSWSGFSFSNVVDDSTQSLANMYAAWAGNQTSGNFGICYNQLNYMVNNAVIPDTVMFLPNNVKPLSIRITNSTWTALTIQNGDAFCKPFGGSSGADPDWFCLHIYGWNGGMITDTVDFYLADYRFADSTLDYIVKDWTLVNLTNLDIVDAITFELASTDTGTFGINTPLLFCFDDLVFQDTYSVSELIPERYDLVFWPNPANDWIEVEGTGKLSLTDISGKTILEIPGNASRADLSFLPEGLYLLRRESNAGTTVGKLLITR